MADEMDPQPLLSLTEDECWKLLGQERVGRLAVSIDNEPDIFPVNFEVADRTLVIRTAPGLKLAAAILGKSVAFEADTIDEATHTGRSVVVRGLASEPETLADRLMAEDLQLRPWASGHKNRFIQIIPTSVSGRELPA